MRARGVVVAVLAGLTGLAVPAAAPAATVTVSMPGRTFSPSHLEIVRGDTVRWSNGSGEAHDVQATGGGFDSGPLAPGGAFEHGFGSAASVSYVCALHRSQMTGHLEVVPVLLRGPGQAIAAGEEAVLEGRAPAGTASVRVERAAAGGAFSPAADLAPGPDGTFALRERPGAPVTYRAVTAEGTSLPVPVGVVDRVEVALRAALGRAVTTMGVATRPARPGATAVLELYSPERFAWRRVARGALDQAGKMTLTLRRGVRRRARVVVLGADGRRLATSRAVLTYRTTRTSRPRPAPAPAPGPHHGHAR